MPRTKNEFWAVAVGRKTGIFSTWEGGAKESINGYRNARHHGFPTREEAEEWLRANTSDTGGSSSSSTSSTYDDSGSSVVTNQPPAPTAVTTKQESAADEKLNGPLQTLNLGGNDRGCRKHDGLPVSDPKSDTARDDAGETKGGRKFNNAGKRRGQGGPRKMGQDSWKDISGKTVSGAMWLSG